MLRSFLLPLALLLCAATVPSSQVEVHVGPSAAPLGCSVLASVSNDTNSTLLIGSIGPIRVFDAAGSEIFFFQALLFVPIPVPAGEAQIYFAWDQRDKQGDLVPPGTYTMEVTLNTSVTTHALTVGGVDAAVASVGVLRPGLSRNLYLCSPQDPGGSYLMAASFTSNAGIATCAGLVPLDPDPLLVFSTTPGNGVFFDTTGVLDGVLIPFGAVATGASTAPLVALPNLPGLSGQSFQAAFVVLDPLLPCPIARISAATTIPIL